MMYIDDDGDTSIYLSNHLSIHPPIHSSMLCIHQFIHPLCTQPSHSFTYLSIDLPIYLYKGDFGRIVNRLTEGCYFGERALMTSELRAATIRVLADSAVTCLVFSRAVYEDIISGTNALLGDR